MSNMLDSKDKLKLDSMHDNYPLNFINYLEGKINNIKTAMTIAKIGIVFAVLGLVISLLFPPRSILSIVCSAIVLIFACAAHAWESNILLSLTNKKDEYIANLIDSNSKLM